MGQKAQAESRARKIVNNWTMIAGGVSWIPGSTLVLEAADIKMVNDVARAFEVREVSTETVFATAGASFAGKRLVELLSFVPGPGWIVKGIVATGITKAMGETMIAYFRGRSPLPDS